MNDRMCMMATGGLGGAMLMYFLDPRSGRRRRAVLRDQAISAGRRGQESLAATWRDARNRGQGLLIEAGRGWRDKPGSEDRADQNQGRFELMQEHWSPAVRMSTGMIGAGLLAFGARRRDSLGATIALLGAATVTRASLNMPWKRITGVAAGHRAVDLNKTMRIAAPLDRVFSFWTRYVDFPKYTHHVREVYDQGEGRSRWTVVGPAGVAVSWNAVITRFVSNREIAWRTEPNSAVEHSGILKFKDNGDGTTTLHARMSYNPPLGAIGHGLAKTVGADLKTLLNEELVRIKTVLEEDVIPRDAQRRESKSSPMLKAEQLEG